MSEIEAERSKPPASTRLMALFETPRGYANVRAIAHSSPRLVALSLGQEDFSAEMGMQGVEGMSLWRFFQAVQVAAREALLMPIGYPGSIAEFTDLAAFRRNVQQASRLGFDGGACIHPRQAPILNGAFSPSESEIKRAISVVDAYDAALAAGKGAAAFQGKMIDVPIVARAKRVLTIVEKIRARIQT